MNNKEFIWTDELVKEFTKGAMKVQDSLPNDVNLDNGLYHFKKEKSKPIEQVKERIEVGYINNTYYPLLPTNKMINPNERTTGNVFMTTKTIPENKYPAIKEAIEKILNEEEPDNQKENSELIKTYDEYILLLSQELDELVGLQYVHGWRSKRYELGKCLREKISLLKLGAKL